jgi:hypothetical protein
LITIFLSIGIPREEEGREGERERASERVLGLLVDKGNVINNRLSIRYRLLIRILNKQPTVDKTIV